MDNSDYGGTRSNPQNANKKLQQTQAQVDEVVGIMRDNVAKVIERDERLSELDRRADNLQSGAAQFEQKAARLKRKYWWQNLKMWIIIGLIGLLILIVIIVSLIPSGSGESAVTNPPAPTIAPNQG